MASYQEYKRKQKIKPILTLLFAAVNIGIFLYSLQWTEGQLLNYAFSLEQVSSGNWQVFFTSGFLHADLLHLFWNTLFLLAFGRIVEKEYGHSLFLAIYFTSMLLGNILLMLIFPDSVAIGASGAVFGLMGAAMLVKPFKPLFKLLPIPIALLGAIYLMGAMSNAFNMSEGIAHIAHVGGALSGILFAFLTHKEESKKGLVVVTLFLVLALALGIGY